MSKKLDKIREKIDKLDHQIHDLLMERAELVSDVAAEKKKHNLQIVHPAREAIMIRRLLSRHESVLPEQAVVRIWRELVGAVSLLQSGLKVVVCDPEGDGSYWDMARNYFGSVIPMQKASNPLSALASVREGEASFAVMPWPVETETNPWWSLLGHQDNENPIKIVCALPYGAQGEGAFSTSSFRGLVISKIDFIDSGDDHSFILAELDAEISRARLHDVVVENGFEPVSIQTQSGVGLGVQSTHIIEVKNHLDADDERFEGLLTSFDSSPCYFSVIGGYPAPPEYKTLPNQNNESAIEAPAKRKKKTGTK